MEFKSVGTTYYLRLEVGEEIVGTLKDFCKRFGITAGAITGIGAVKSATLGFFEPVAKKYHQNTFTGAFEMVSLIGNISVMNQEPYLHLHAAFAGADFHLIGGHLVDATISATGEICIQKENTTLNRKFYPEIGLNLYDLNLNP